MVDVAVIIPTYNRAATLATAIESVLSQSAGGTTYEIVVVDNNSTDDTGSVVERYTGRHGKVKYLLEERQGTSNARNTGIRKTTAKILAFLDDDVRADPEWVSTIKQTFDRNPDVMWIGGKVLPIWNDSPPAWLTRAHWAPLALTDHGDESLRIDSQHPMILISANLGVRRSAFDRFGLFSPEFYRCEDHELELRFLRGGAKGLYVPEIVVTADVQDERLYKGYHRSWYSEHGIMCARMRAYEDSTFVNEPVEARPTTLRYRGVPVYVFRELLKHLVRLAKAPMARDESERFLRELIVRDRLNYIRETIKLAEPTSRNPLSEGAKIAWDLVVKKSNMKRKSAYREGEID